MAMPQLCPCPRALSPANEPGSDALPAARAIVAALVAVADGRRPAADAEQARAALLIRAITNGGCDHG